MPWILVLPLALIFLIWLSAFLYFNDFTLPFGNLANFNNILLIFPHADDEVLNSGGLINKFFQAGKNVSLLILTKGEKGNPAGERDDSLKAIRTHEAQTSSKILGITNLIQNDLGDGDLINQRTKVTATVATALAQIKPDLVITYDLAGLYGHPDHILVSEVVTDLLDKQFSQSRLWYLSYPKKVLATKNLPEHMAKNPDFKSRRTIPNLRIFIGLSIFAKIKALYAYRSQRQSYKSSLPISWLPLWFVHSLWLFEYFYQVK